MDVESAIQFLKTRNEIDSARIGLIGHSDGAMIAPMVAARSNDVSFIVMLAGPGILGSELMVKRQVLFYIHAITQNSKIKDVEVVSDLSLRIEFDNGYTIVAPSIDEYAEYPWIIDSHDDPRFPDFYFRMDGEDMTIYSKMDS